MSTLLNWLLKKPKDENLEQRLTRRYVPGPGYNLPVQLKVSGQIVPASLLDISGFGLGLSLDPEVAIVVDEEVEVFLAKDGSEFNTTGRIAHLRLFENNTLCGIELKFDSLVLQQTYLQYLQPIAIGQSLEPQSSLPALSPPEGLSQDIFEGITGSRLRVFRKQSAEGELHSFEFHLHEFLCTAQVAVGKMEVRRIGLWQSESETGSGPPTEDENRAQRASENDAAVGMDQAHPQAQIVEGWCLFRAVVTNLSDAIPEDVRAFLDYLAQTSHPDSKTCFE